MVSWLSMVRAIAVLATVAAVVASQGTGMWRPLVATLGLGHYFVGLLYSGNQIRQVVSEPRRAMALVGLGAAGAALYVSDFSLLVLFGIHHAFNEAYILEKAVDGSHDRRLHRLRAMGVALHLAIYLFILRWSLGASLGSSPRLFALLTVFLAVSVVGYGWMLREARHAMSPHQFRDCCMAALSGIAFVGLSLFVRFDLLHVVLYHFVFWMIFPVAGIARKGASRVARYGALTIAVNTVFFGIWLAGRDAVQGAAMLFFEQFYFWSYVHIATTLALSSANPKWLNDWFRPAALPRAIGPVPLRRIG